jgi:hypothetical protein
MERDWSFLFNTAIVLLAIIFYHRKQSICMAMVIHVLYSCFGRQSTYMAMAIYVLCSCSANNIDSGRSNSKY